MGGSTWERSAIGPVKQHYVPQCYLRQFAIRYRKKGHQLAVFDRETDKSFRANVKDVACQNYFNRIEVDGMDPNAVEKAMSEFESKLADALVRINETRSLESEEDRAHLITLIALTALRNPEMRENIRVAVANSAMTASADRQVYARNHNFSCAQTPEETLRRGFQLISDKRFPR
jgi:Protein of unknown function (DUF4238)